VVVHHVCFPCHFIKIWLILCRRGSGLIERIT
jgi:hypothetical protein